MAFSMRMPRMKSTTDMPVSAFTFLNKSDVLTPISLAKLSLPKSASSKCRAANSNATDEIQLDRYSELSKVGATIAYVDTTNYFAGWKIVLNARNAYVQYDDVDFGITGLTSVTA